LVGRIVTRTANRSTSIIEGVDDQVTEGVMPVADPREAERQLWSASGQGVLVDLRTGEQAADDPAHGAGMWVLAALDR